MKDVIPWIVITFFTVSFIIASVNGILDSDDNTAGWS